MRQIKFFCAPGLMTLWFLLLLISFSIQSFAQYNYPATKTVDTADTYFGTVIKDPYRWLENLNDSSVIKWFKAQEDYTNSIISKLPGQQNIINELEKIDRVQNIKYIDEWIAGKGFVVEKIFPGEQTSKYYYRSTGNSKDVLLFDPASYEKGKVMDVGNVDVIIDGKYIYFQLSEQGKEGGAVRIMEVQTGKWLSEEIKNVGWFVDFIKNNSNEILYVSVKNGDVHSKDARENNITMLHVIGTPQSADREILSMKKYPELGFNPSDVAVLETFYGCPYMFTRRQTSWGIYEMYFASLSELKNNKIDWKPFCKGIDEIHEICVHGNDIYCKTSKGNNHYSLLKLTLPEGNLATAIEIYAGDKDWKISDAEPSKDYLVIGLNKNSILRKTIRYDYASGKTEEIHSSLQGNTIISPYGPFTNKCMAVSFGWNLPNTMYDYNLETGKFSNGLFHVEYKYPGLENIVVEEVEVPSYDGTLVPLSILYNKKYLKKDGTNTCLITGYGCYGSSMQPFINPHQLPLLNRGAVIAIAHVRGGGEKGEDWHLGGQKTTKPNTWKDFNACAEWLIKSKYTSAQKLGCEGGSAGGILIGRAITERPDLYKVAMPESPVLNTIRFESMPGGASQIPEYGTMKDSIEAKALIEMDALYHVKSNTQYPSQLIFTGFNDPRVISWQPGKFAASMQAANNSATPTLLQVNYKGGHFGGSTANEQYAETALGYAFLLWQCGNKEFQLK